MISRRAWHQYRSNGGSVNGGSIKAARARRNINKCASCVLAALASRAVYFHRYLADRGALGDITAASVSVQTRTRDQHRVARQTAGMFSAASRSSRKHHHSVAALAARHLHHQRAAAWRRSTSRRQRINKAAASSAYISISVAAAHKGGIIASSKLSACRGRHGVSIAAWRHQHLWRHRAANITWQKI